MRPRSRKFVFFPHLPPDAFIPAASPASRVAFFLIALRLSKWVAWWSKIFVVFLVKKYLGNLPGCLTKRREVDLHHRLPLGRAKFEQRRWILANKNLDCKLNAFFPLFLPWFVWLSIRSIDTTAKDETWPGSKTDVSINTWLAAKWRWHLVECVARSAAAKHCHAFTKFRTGHGHWLEHYVILHGNLVHDPFGHPQPSNGIPWSIGN